jgi:hypothetical protein
VDLANLLAHLAAPFPGGGFGLGNDIFVFPPEDSQPTGGFFAEILTTLSFPTM